jgi:hypothetical protein
VEGFCLVISVIGRSKCTGKEEEEEDGGGAVFASLGSMTFT